jgi:hypothetical protein
MGFMDAKDETRAIDQLRSELTQAFPSIPPQRVNATIDAELHQYDQVKVRDFVPLLVQREVTKELKTAAI